MPLPKILPLFFVLLFAPIIVQTICAQASSAGSSGPAMNNADVVALVGAGLSDDIVIAKVEAAPSTAFDTSVTGLTALKKANVSPAVIRAMINPHPLAAAANPYVAGSPAAPAGDPDDPNAQHSPGLYTVMQGADGGVHLTKLQSENPRGVTNNGLFVHALTHGITSAKTQQVIDGAKAAIELPQAKPVFYAYIPDSGGSFVGGMNVNDLVLTKLTVKGDTRLWTFASSGLIGGSNEIGSDQRNRQGFTTEQIKPGIYKLKPAADLPAGQYAFKYASFFFDFGVQPQS